MADKSKIDRLAEQYAVGIKKKRKPLSYATKLIVVLSVTAAIVCASAVCLGLYFGGVFDKPLTVDTDGEEGKQEIYEGFVDYSFDPNKMPAGSYAEFTLGAEGRSYTVKAYLFSDYAPNTVNNFISYANKGFYNGKTFGEVTLGYTDGIPDSGRIICGGYKRNDNGDLTYELADGAKPIAGEFLENGYEKNKLSNTAGVIGMLHGANADDATTDFYVLPFDDIALNGRYAAFAKITDSTGLGVVRALAKKAYEQNVVVTITQVKITNKA